MHWHNNIRWNFDDGLEIWPQAHAFCNKITFSNDSYFNLTWIIKIIAYHLTLLNEDSPFSWIVVLLRHIIWMWVCHSNLPYLLRSFFFYINKILTRIPLTTISTIIHSNFHGITSPSKIKLDACVYSLLQEILDWNKNF